MIFFIDDEFLLMVIALYVDITCCSFTCKLQASLTFTSYWTQIFTWANQLVTKKVDTIILCVSHKRGLHQYFGFTCCDTQSNVASPRPQRIQVPERVLIHSVVHFQIWLPVSTHYIMLGGLEFGEQMKLLLHQLLYQWVPLFQEVDLLIEIVQIMHGPSPQHLVLH